MIRPSIGRRSTTMSSPARRPESPPPSMSPITRSTGIPKQAGLPGFVAMSPRAQPRGKFANWGNAFLPGAYSGTYVNIHDMQPDRILSDLQNQWLPLLLLW